MTPEELARLGAAIELLGRCVRRAVEYDRAGLEGPRPGESEAQCHARLVELCAATGAASAGVLEAITGGRRVGGRWLFGTGEEQG